jgi:hypothetical protein
MIDYNKHINNLLKKSEYNRIDHIPQPEMFTGGLRLMKHPLPQYDSSPSTLSVSGGSRKSKKMMMMEGSGFFDDVGNAFKSIVNNPIVEKIAPIAATALLAAGRNKKVHPHKYLMMHPDLAKHILNHPKGGSFLSSIENIVNKVSKNPIVQKIADKGIDKIVDIGLKKLEGGKIPKDKKKSTVRGELVKKIMKEKKLNLAQASKYIKANNLY